MSTSHDRSSQEFVEALARGDWTRVELAMSPELKSRLPPSALAEAWSNARGARGAFLRATPLRRWRADDATDIVVVVAEFQGGGRVDAQIAFHAGLPETVTGIALAPGESTARAVDALQRFVAGDIDAVYGRFDARMRGALGRDALVQTWADTSKRLGAFDHFEEAKTAPAGDDDGVRITAAFAKRKADFLLKVNRRTGEFRAFGIQPRAATPPTYTAPAYVTPAAFEEQERRVNGLPATLTLPRQAGPHPAVVLVHGSGPQDRDETQGAQRPFRDLACGLASRGFAVLRYDKRTYGANAASMPPSSTVDDEVTNDAVAAVRLVAREPGVDASRIVLVGHSLGAMLAPRVVEMEPSVAALVLLAPPARPFEDVLLEQVTAQRSLTQEALASLRAKVARVKSSDLRADTPASDLPLNIPASYWLSLRGYDPVTVAHDVNRPALVLHGALDRHVTAVDFQRWKESGLPAGVTAAEFEGLNHLFSHTADTEAGYETADHVDPRIIRTIDDWLRETLSSRPGLTPVKPE